MLRQTGTMRTRWLFADQLGPHFVDDPAQPVLLIESKAVFRRRAFHRQKAHLVLSALRHRARDDNVRLVRAETYAQGAGDQPLTVCHPTSRAARGLVRRLPDVEMLPPRGFVTISCVAATRPPWWREWCASASPCRSRTEPR